MSKVMIVMLDGSKMLFPAEYAKKVVRKNELVLAAVEYQNQMKDPSITPEVKKFFDRELTRVMKSIRSLNRQIPPCGTTIQENV